MSTSRIMLLGTAGCVVALAALALVMVLLPPADRPQVGRRFHLDEAALPADYSEVEFALSAKPQISYARFPRTHGALPTFGENKYSYDGDVVWASGCVRLKVDDFEPRLLIKINGEYFLLAKYHFRDAGDFCWFRATARSVFVRLAGGELDEKFWRVAVAEPRQTYYYRVWLLDALASTVPPARVRQCFDALLAIDRRFAYDEAWGNRELGRARDLQSFLQCVSEGKVSELWEPLTVLLEIAKPGDDPQIIGNVSSALYAIDSGRAKPLLCDYLRRWRAEGVQGDMRRMAIRDTMRFAKFECDDEGATSQATGPTTQGG